MLSAALAEADTAAKTKRPSKALLSVGKCWQSKPHAQGNVCFTIALISLGLSKADAHTGALHLSTEHVGLRVDTVGRSSGLKFVNPVDVVRVPRIHRDALGLEIAVCAGELGQGLTQSWSPSLN